MTALPDPLTPPDCDLRGNEWMPLHGNRMLGSKFWGLARRNPKAGLVAIRLWWTCFNQVPAASLPNDDFDLAELAGFGEDLKSWRAVKEIALHGFILCSDGRIYHPFVAEEAIVAYAIRLKADAKREKDRKRLAEWREKQAAQRAAKQRPPDDEMPMETKTETRFVEGLQDRTRQKKGSGLRPGADAPPIDARAQLWTEGVPIIRQLVGKSEPQSRAVLGRLLKAARDDCPATLGVLRRAADLQPADPMGWLTAAAKQVAGEKPGDMTLIRQEIGAPNNEFVIEGFNDQGSLLG